MGDGEEMSSGHAPGDQPTGNNQNSGHFWRNPPDWCYVNDEGNSTAYLGPNRRSSNRGMLDHSVDRSFQHLSRSGFVASNNEFLPMPSRTSDFSSFADPPSGSLHQTIPNSKPGDEPKPLPDNEGAKKEPMAENQGLFAAAGNPDNDADKDTGDSYQGETKRIFRLDTRADKAYDSDEVLDPKIRAKFLLEGENKSPVPVNRGQRKSEACKDRGPEVADSLQEEQPPSTPGGDTDHDADSHFRGQRKSKAQVPREDADVSHQRSPSSPDTALDRDLPLVATSAVGRSEDTSNIKGHSGDTSTTRRDTQNTSTTEGDTEDQEEIREAALQTQSSGQDPGTEQGNRGQRKGNLGNAGLAAGHSGRDSDTAKSSDKETLRSIVGTMPTGSMNCSVKLGTHVPGFEGCGVIVVDYDIPDGIQKTEHPQTGRPYCGCVEHAFLPDNDEGRRVLGMLKEAFDRRLTFQVCEQPGGQALVEWADIPHKTCLRGTRDRGGYPDPDYLETVRGILREKYGIE